MAAASRNFKSLLKTAIRRIRVEGGLSIAQIEEGLGTEIGYSASVIQAWRKPTGKMPGMQSLEKLAEALARRSGLRNPEEVVTFLTWGGHPYPREVAARICPGNGANHLTESASLGNHLPFAPFVVGKPILHPRQFYGRQAVVKRIFGLLPRAPLSNIALIGPKRSGKTSLLHYLRKITTVDPAELRVGQFQPWLPNPERYRWLFVDFQDASICSLEPLLRFLLEGMELPVPAPLSISSFMAAAKFQIHQPTVILMDEIDCALRTADLGEDRVWDCLRSLANNGSDGNLSFILAGRAAPAEIIRHYAGFSSPFFNTFGYTHQVGPFTDEEALELISGSPRPFAPEDIAWIMAESRRWPIILQSLCSIRLSTLDEAGEDWKTEARQQIESYHPLLQEEAG